MSAPRISHPVFARYYARMLGLTTGSVHAELRITQHPGQPRPAMLELAARSIAACAHGRSGSPAARPSKS